MQARHSHPNRPKGSADYIKEIYQSDLPCAQGLYLSEVIWEDTQMVSIYLHRIEGLLQADTYLNEQQDTYAIIVDGPVMYAFNIGGFPEPQFFLFDFAHYQTLKDKEDRFHYLAYACLGGEGLSNNTLIHLYDQHRKVMLEEFYREAYYR